jgi:hypothetical protein
MSEVMEKRPHEVLDYTFDFTRWLSSGDAIAEATADVVGGTVAIDRVTHNGSSAVAWASGGAAGVTAEITVKIRSQLGRRKEAVLRLRIRD